MDLKKCFLIVLFAISLAFAQRDSLPTYNVPDVVITATRTSLPISESASSISVIDSSEIAVRHASTILDLLKEQYGLSFTQQGGSGKLAYVNIRGGNPGHTLVLIDGIEMNMPNDPSNTYDFSYLTPDNVNRIEVLRGPQSTLYGSDAVSGVINIITNKGMGRPAYSLSAEGGSYGTYKGTAGLKGSLNLLNYSVTASKFSTQGFSSASEKYGNTERDPSMYYNVSSRLGADVSPLLSLALITRFSSGKSSYDQFGGIGGDDPTYIFDFEELANRLEATASLFDGLWKPSAGVSLMRNIRKYSFDPYPSNYMDSSRSHYDGLKIKADYLNNFQLTTWNQLTLGFEYEKEVAVSEYYSKFFNSLFDQHNTLTGGVFLQEQINIDDQLFTSAGIRYDKNNRFGSVTTYRMAPAYIIKETGTKLKFTVGNAFKAPSLFYLFDPQYGNPALKPEKSIGWDAGVEQFIHPNISLGVTYFKSTFTDLFGFNEAFKTININKAESYGTEFYSSAKVWQVNLKLNYTWNKTKDLSTPDGGNALIRRPEHKFSIIASGDITPRLSSAIELLYVGERFDKDFATFPVATIKIPSYLLVNISASYKLLDELEIYGRINNLLDTDYEEILGYGTARLSGYAGLRINF